MGFIPNFTKITLDNWVKKYYIISIDSEKKE